MSVPYIAVQYYAGLMNNRAGIVQHNAFRDCLNIDLDKNGMPSTRYGSKYLENDAGDDYDPITASAPINGVYQFYNDSGAYKMVATGGGNVFTFDGTDPVAIGGSLSLTGGRDVITQFCEATLNDSTGILVSTSGVDGDKLWYWNGIDAAATQFPSDSAVPTGSKAIAWFKGFMIHANYEKSGTRYQNRVCWSNVFDPLTYDDANAMPIGSHNEPIVALHPFLDYLVVLKKRSIWLLVPNYDAQPLVNQNIVADPFREQHIHGKIGCDSPRAVFNSDNLLVFLNRSGWFSYDGRGTNEDNINKMSKHIDLSGMDRTRMETCHAAYLGDRAQGRIWLDAADETLLQYFYSLHMDVVDRNLEIPAVTLNSLTVSDSVGAANCSYEGVDPITEQQTIFLGTQDGRVVQMEQSDFQDLDGAIRSYYKTAYWNCRTNRLKRWNHVKLYNKTRDCTMVVTQYAKLGDIHVQDTLDFSTSEGTWPYVWPITWGAGIYTDRDMGLDGVSRFTSIGAEVNTAGHALEVVRTEIEFDIADH